MSKETLILMALWVLAIILLVAYAAVGGIFCLLLWIYSIYFMWTNTPKSKRSIGIIICWFLALLGLLIWAIVISPERTDWIA